MSYSQILKRTMQRSSSPTATGDLFRNNPALYREFLAERDEILRHKWLESEKAGKDIGFERPLLDWLIKHRVSWREGRHPVTGKAPECQSA
jgi:hypothetical protein